MRKKFWFYENILYTSFVLSQKRNQTEKYLRAPLFLCVFDFVAYIRQTQIDPSIICYRIIERWELLIRKEDFLESVLQSKTISSIFFYFLYTLTMPRIKLEHIGALSKGKKIAWFHLFFLYTRNHAEENLTYYCPLCLYRCSRRTSFLDLSRKTKAHRRYLAPLITRSYTEYRAREPEREDHSSWVRVYRRSEISYILWDTALYLFRLSHRCYCFRISHSRLLWCCQIS